MKRSVAYVIVALAVITVASACSGSVVSSAVRPTTPPTLTAAATPAPIPTPTPTATPLPTPAPTPAPTGYAAALAELDAPGVIMMSQAVGHDPNTPWFFESSWNIRSIVLHDDGWGWKFPEALPKPSPDAAGNPMVRVTLGKGGLSIDVVMTTNSDGSLLSVALVTPSGGYGGLEPYLTTGIIYELFADVLRPAEALEPSDGLGLSIKDTSRSGVDRTYDASGLRFHFIGTADDGEWLIATSLP